MIWRPNRDGVPVLYDVADAVDAARGYGGYWRGTWRHDDEVVYGFLAAIWHPYRRVGRFKSAAEAATAVEHAAAERRG